ncbi:hypothetical protein SRHO_G00264340 [Serrasalmus rhombeus]
MANLEELKQVICSTLPGLSEETLKKLVDGLVAVGVETQADLQFVKEEDLLEHLKPIQCSKLLNAWKCEGDKMNPERWMLSVEGKIVLGSYSDTFIEGLSGLFATYYTFNLEYQEGAASTLEFIQSTVHAYHSNYGEITRPWPGDASSSVSLEMGAACASAYAMCRCDWLRSAVTQCHATAPYELEEDAGRRLVSVLSAHSDPDYGLTQSLTPLLFF